ncbi:MAG: NUDIX hydrolase [Rhodobacteraceae bacterium]|nr:NUDIX hydrolase [Paracoccaceae bacterium]MCY4197330.1 NUDIX hydrolase [Paracoccaceae bacterium]
MTKSPAPETSVRDAATVILLRRQNSEPQLLFGQRRKKAVFMPNKFVFPGGGIEATDSNVPLCGYPRAQCLQRLAYRSPAGIVKSLLSCAIREVWEETGIRLAQHNTTQSLILPDEWEPFTRNGLIPSARGLEFLYRAVTPPGQVRRFDARFFLADFDHIDVASDPDRLQPASNELKNLRWVPLTHFDQLDLPAITKRVIAHLYRVLRGHKGVTGVPFIYTKDGRRITEMINN